jgi:hypothetical protein
LLPRSKVAGILICVWRRQARPLLQFLWAHLRQPKERAFSLPAEPATALPGGFIAARWANATATRTELHCNVSGEDRTPIELFIAGVRGWEAGLRSQLENGKSLSE